MYAVADYLVMVLQCTRVIQKISSVCEYCRCSAAVTMVHVRAEFVDSVTRHGHNLQTFEQFFYELCCVCIMFKKTENPAARKNLITTFGWEQFDHPSYSPDLAPGDCHLFLHIKSFVAGR